jgi:RNA polymerase sigma-70 factor (ECF subfamily)
MFMLSKGNAQPDSVESTDEEIITSYKNGNQGAFKVLINRYTSRLYNFTARLTNQNDASDIVQEVFIKVWKNIHHFDGTKASFRTWIFTIARNTTTDFLRKKKSLLFSDIPARTSGKKESDEDINSFAENIPDDNLLPDEALQKLQDKTEDQRFLNDILEKLHPNYREVLVLHYQEEMAFEEIGKILGKPLNTIKSQHQRAIMELRKMLN